MSAPPSRSGEAQRPRWPPGRLFALVLAILAARLIAAALVPLTEDEAYYRLWAGAPALGYYDHPPMIAWWIWAGRRLLGDNPLGVRLLPALASALASFIVWDCARLADFGEATAVRAAVWWNATLTIAAGGFLATPDAPASFLWILTLNAMLRALRQPPWWLAAGCVAGLACLAKYSTLFLGPGALLWLLASGEGRAALRRPGPWIAAALAVAIFAVNIFWNAQHHWLTFARQFGRVAPHGFEPRFLAELLVAQGLLFNPLITPFLVRALSSRPLRRSLAPFLLTSAPFALYLLLHALHDRVEGHWPVPLYAAAAISAAAAAQGAQGAWRGLKRTAPYLGFAGAGLALSFAALPADPLAFGPDPALILRGWNGFGGAIERRAEAAGAAWIGTLSYGATAMLADTRALRRPVIEIVDRQRWSGLARAAPDLSRPGLVVDLPRRIEPALLRDCFVRAQPLPDARRPDGARGEPYAVWFVEGPRGDLLDAGCRRP